LEHESDNCDSEGDAHLKAVLRTELAASNTKLSQLRASIADLAEENDRNLAEVQRRGLAGAVKLARKLRDELRLVEDDLREVRSAEAGLRVRVGLVTAELERLEAAKESESKAKTGTAADAQSKMQARASGATSPAPHESIANEDDVLISDDEEFQKYVAQQDTVDPPGADVTDYHQGSDESDEDGVLVNRSSLSIVSFLWQHERTAFGKYQGWSLDRTSCWFQWILIGRSLDNPQAHRRFRKSRGTRIG